VLDALTGRQPQLVGLSRQLDSSRSKYCQSQSSMHLNGIDLSSCKLFAAVKHPHVLETHGHPYACQLVPAVAVIWRHENAVRGQQQKVIFKQCI
jgi:hypothetical protein